MVARLIDPRVQLNGNAGSRIEEGMRIIAKEEPLVEDSCQTIAAATTTMTAITFAIGSVAATGTTSGFPRRHDLFCNLQWITRKQIIIKHCVIQVLQTISLTSIIFKNFHSV